MRPIIPFGLAGVLFASASFAVNPICGFYGGLLGEVSYAPSIDFQALVTPFSLTPIPGELSYKILGGGGGQLGYRISDNFRVEVQGLFNSNDFDEIKVGNLVIDRNIAGDTSKPLTMTGKTNVVAGFINAYYDILTSGTDSSFAPYLGLGIGYISLKNSVTFYQNGVAIPPGSVSSTESDAGAQGIIGFSYFMDDFTWASMDYRYISTNNIKDFNNKRYELHTLNFTINFSFEGFMS